jgi:hypothetical protein
MRRKSRIDATVEVPAGDPRDAAQQRHAIEQALRAAGFTINELVLYSRDDDPNPFAEDPTGNPFNCPAGYVNCTGAAFPGHVAHKPARKD